MKAEYLIGIYGSLERERFEREWRPWFSGVELASLDDQAEVERVLTFIRERNLRFGIHYPLMSNQDPSVLHPMVSSFQEAERISALLSVSQAAEAGKALGATYLLIHFPKPAILSSRLDWQDWRFPQPGEAILDRDVSNEDVEAVAEQAFSALAAISTATELPLVLEMDILHCWYYQGLIERLYRTHSGLGLCLDTGRLHLQQATDAGLNIIELIHSLREWVTNVHLWTVKVGENRSGGHHPLLPELVPEDGWGPMRDILTALSSVNAARVLFEHRSHLVSAEDLERCYQWVAACLALPAPSSATNL